MLHPNDMAAVTDAWVDDLGELRVEPDPNVIRGGCRIQRNDSFVDATIETQLRNIIMELANMPGPIGSSGDPGDLLDGAEVEANINRLEAEETTLSKSHFQPVSQRFADLADKKTLLQKLAPSVS